MKENTIGKEVVDAAVKVHAKQRFTYLKLRGLKLGVPGCGSIRVIREIRG